MLSKFSQKKKRGKGNKTFEELFFNCCGRGAEVSNVLWVVLEPIWDYQVSKVVVGQDQNDE